MSAYHADMVKFLTKLSELGVSHVKIEGETCLEVTFGHQSGIQVVPHTTIATDSQVISDLMTGTRTAKEMLEEGEITPRQRIELEMAIQEQVDHDHYRSA